MLAVLIAGAAPARAQIGLSALLESRGSFGQTRQVPPHVSSGRILDPVSLGASPVVGAREAARNRFDVAVVLLEPRGGNGRAARAEVEAYWAALRFRVAPRPSVQRAITDLGVLTPDALAAADYPQLGRALGVRHLVLLSVGTDGARREFFSGVGAPVLGAGALLSLRDGPRGPLGRGIGPAVMVLAAAVVAGITTAATCELSSQIFDCAAGRPRGRHQTRSLRCCWRPRCRRRCPGSRPF